MIEKLQPHKPKYTAFVATSVDGRSSLTEKTLPDWNSQEDRQFLHQSLSHMDAVVVGRKTYEAAAKHLRKRITYVFSSRPTTLCHRESVTFVNPVRVDLEKLFQDHKNVAVLGGGMAYRFMLENHLLDELFVTVEPLIFGRGTPMFTGGTKTTRLDLLSSRPLNSSGTLLLHYRINH